MLYAPRHRATDRDETRSYTEAKCSGIARAGFPDPGHVGCPRHDAVYYSEYMARHATDSIPHVDRDPWTSADRAERYHTFGITR